MVAAAALLLESGALLSRAEDDRLGAGVAACASRSIDVRGAVATGAVGARHRSRSRRTPLGLDFADDPETRAGAGRTGRTPAEPPGLACGPRGPWEPAASPIGPASPFGPGGPARTLSAGRTRWTLRTPEGPGKPCGPTGPASPFEPCGPITPAIPAAPFGPGDPTGPGGPAAPASPFGPCGPISPFVPALPLGPAGPGGPGSPRPLSLRTLWADLLHWSRHRPLAQAVQRVRPARRPQPLPSDLAGRSLH